MAIIVSSNGKDFEKPKTGWHQAVCSNVYGPFTESYEWQGKTVTAKKVVILFELDQLITEGEYKGKRFTTSGRFTASLHEKGKLRPFLEAWKGKAFTEEGLERFDLELLIGVNCNVSLIEKEKRGGGKSVLIASIGPRREEQEKMVPELPRDFAPKWIKDILAAQQGTDSGHASPDDFQDDVPF
jgi:hypothetical protein